MTPSIRQVPKLIFHDVDPGDPSAPLKIPKIAINIYMQLLWENKDQKCGIYLPYCA